MTNANGLDDIKNKLEKLEKKLKEYCTQNNLEFLGSFTLMFNEEEGRNISYVKDMDMSKMGWTMHFYDSSSKFYNPEHGNIEWPYTGFVQGPECQPLSVPDLAELLEGSPYLEDPSPLRKNFIKHFEK